MSIIPRKLGPSNLRNDPLGFDCMDQGPMYPCLRNESWSQKYDVNMMVADTEDKGEVKKRAGKTNKEDKASTENATPNGTKQLTFDLQCLKSVQTDFEKDGGFQKVVRFSADHTLLATGGADGFLRVWKV